MAEKKKRRAPAAKVPIPIPAEMKAELAAPPDPNVMPDITGPGGAPTKYKPEYDMKLIQHMAKGMSFQSFGAEVDVSAATLYEWKKANASFNDAYGIGYEKYRSFWERLGIAYSVNNKLVEIDVLDKKGNVRRVKKNSGESLNSSLYAFQMSNRFREDWQRSPEVAIQNNTQVNVYQAILEGIEERKKRGESVE